MLAAIKPVHVASRVATPPLPSARTPNILSPRTIWVRLQHVIAAVPIQRLEGVPRVHLGCPPMVKTTYRTVPLRTRFFLSLTSGVRGNIALAHLLSGLLYLSSHILPGRCFSLRSTFCFIVSSQIKADIDFEGDRSYSFTSLISFFYTINAFAQRSIDILKYSLCCTNWWCTDCKMPLCQMDRTCAFRFRQQSCLEEHLASKNKHLGCNGRKWTSFKMPEELKVCVQTRSSKAKKQTKRAASMITPPKKTKRAREQV